MELCYVVAHRCLMGNGRSPEGLTLEAVRERGVRGGALPPFHALTVTVPGAAAAWEDAVRLWGKLSLEQARRCTRIGSSTEPACLS